MIRTDDPPTVVKLQGCDGGRLLLQSGEYLWLHATAVVNDQTYTYDAEENARWLRKYWRIKHK